jgi:hypothetical protein
MAVHFWTGKADRRADFGNARGCAILDRIAIVAVR